MSGVSDARDSHYFDADPSVASRVMTYAIEGPRSTLTVESDSGVFSHGSLDKATALLLARIADVLVDLPDGDLLDLGCGAGPIALVLAQLFPGRTVWAVDTNSRALELTSRNAAANDLPNIRAVVPSDVPGDARIAGIVSNPPIRIGKPELHAMLDHWFSRVRGGGRALMVVGRHLGADSLQKWLGDQGWPTDRVGSSKGFRLLLTLFTDAAG